VSVAFPIERPDLQAGLVGGVLALALALAVRVPLRVAGADRFFRTGGALLAAAGCAALARQGLLPAELVWALVLLAVGGAATGTPALRPLAAVALGPGAVLLAAAVDTRHVPWPDVAAVATALGGGFLVADFDERFRRRGLAPVLFAISAYGVYAVVPETDAALVLVGASLPLALVGWPVPLDGLGRAGAFGACGLFGWVVAHGGAARTSALVGGAASLGLLVLEPIVRRCARRRTSPLDAIRPGPGRVPLVAALHAGVVFVVGRLAGTRPRAWEALLIAGVGSALAIRLGLAALRRIPSRRP
jgi:hypothetical protein